MKSIEYGWLRFLTRDSVLMLFFFLINLVLKSLYIAANDIAMDEPFTIFWANVPFGEFFQMLKSENNPPLFFILMHFWIRLFGTGVVSVRALPVLFSSLAAAGLFRMGSKFFSKGAGVLAAILFTFSNLMIYHAHDCRAYSLFVWLTIVSMYLFLDYYRQPSRKTFILLSVVNAALIYTHFFAFFVLIVQTAYVLFHASLRKKIAGRYFLSLLAVMIAYTPYWILFFIRFFQAAGKGTWVAKPQLPALYGRLVVFFNEPVVAVVAILIFLWGLFAWFYYRSRRSPEKLLVYTWFLAPYVFMFAVSYKVPMFIPKYLVYIVPAAFLSVGIIVTEMPKRLVKWIAGILICVLMIATVNLKAGHEREVKKVVNRVTDARKNTLPVFICPPWYQLNFAYYYDRELFEAGGDIRRNLGNRGIYPVYNAGEISDSMLEQSTGAIYIDAWGELTDPENSIPAKLKARHGPPKEEFIDPCRIYFYGNADK